MESNHEDVLSEIEGKISDLNEQISEILARNMKYKKQLEKTKYGFPIAHQY